MAWNMRPDRLFKNIDKTSDYHLLITYCDEISRFVRCLTNEDDVGTLLSKIDIFINEKIESGV